MKNLNRKVAILGGSRVPFVKSLTHYKNVSNQEMLTVTLKDLVKKFNLQNHVLGDVALGALITHTADWNLAREAVLGSGLHPTTPAYNVQRACGTSLETASHIALKIATGEIDVGVAGGSDTNSDLPLAFSREFARKFVDFSMAKNFTDKLKALAAIRPKDFKPQIPGVREPRTGLSMGEHCEKMVKEWKIDRASQDELTLKSHKSAAKAYDNGFYSDLVISFKGLEKDSIVRGDTSLEKLSKLKPAFDFSGQGTLTAGNSTPLSDGASVTLLSSEDWAKKNNIPIQAYFIDAQAAAVDYVGGEGLLMAPTIAVKNLLLRNNITLQDFDFYEIHEAFSGQVLCTLKAWQSPEYCQKRLGIDKPLGAIDLSKLNIKGGSVALGHPFAATGSRILTTLAKIISLEKKGRGLISICTAGGMGVAAIINSSAE